MKYFYDLHLHSCLSPCGDDDMTPNNITGMAKLLGLDVIALTDHNSCLNCEATMKAGEENGVLVIPGMELTTSEDIHAVCLFPTLERALDWNEYVDANRIKVKNKAEIYGRQVIMNALDEEIGEVEHLLLPATFISIMDAYKKAKEFGGICYPAHIDRPANGAIEILGAFPHYAGFRLAELNDRSNRDAYVSAYGLEDIRFLVGSDAHYLNQLREGDENDWFEIDADLKDEALVVGKLFEDLRNH